MKQKYKKLAFFILLLSMLTGCMLLSGCTENTENGSQSSYIVDSDELQDTENQMEFVPGSMKGSKQEETSENEEQGQTEQSRQTVAEENDAEQAKTAGNLEVHFIDVGQGDATLIKCDGHSMLIDAGNNDKGTLVQNYLQHQGVETLDYVIGTHPDADHIGGMDVVLYKFDCKTIIMPDVANNTRTYDDVVQTMKNKGYKTTYPVVGETYTIGGASLLRNPLLHPDFLHFSTHTMHFHRHLMPPPSLSLHHTPELAQLSRDRFVPPHFLCLKRSSLH